MKLKRYSRRLSVLRVYVLMLLCLLFVSAVAGNALAAMKLTKTADGFTATLSVSPKMADLLLVDAASGKAVTDAVVTATLVHPDGQKSDMKLIGMKMGEGYSYMNSIDMSAKGIYTFHIIVQAGEKSVKFDFENGVI